MELMQHRTIESISDYLPTVCLCERNIHVMYEDAFI